LTDKGFDVKVAVDSISGIQKAIQFRPELIILDLMMPAGGGIAVLESMRNSVLLQTTPVIVITGSEDTELMQKLKKYSIQAYLQKPFRLEKLLQTISKIITFDP
jgi:DNA-binding response OmpR family regulator